MKFRFFLLLLVFSNSFSNAQLVYWQNVWYQNNSNITDIKIASNGYLFACNGSRILKSVDGGSTWSGISLYNTSKMVIDNQDNIYVAKRGSYPGIVKSTDNGLTWNDSYSGYVNASSIYITKEGDIYVGDDSGAFIKSTDSGNSWVIVSITDKAITSIAVLDSGKIFVSTEGKSLFSSFDYGDSWTQILNPNLFYTIESIVADTNDYLYAEHSEKISRSTDLGITWELVGFIPSYPEVPVLNIDESNNLYYGYYGLYKSTDQGLIWSYLGGPSYVSCILIDSNRIFLGTYNSIYRYDPDRPIYVGNNYLPLRVGNKWQYYGTEVYYAMGIYYYYYYLSLVSIDSDTLINQNKYYKYHSDWVRYSEEDKKIYVWVDNEDRLYLDMTRIPATSYVQYSIFSPGFNHIYRTVEHLHGNTNLFGTTSNYKGFSFDSSMYGAEEWESEKYNENFGMSYFYYGAHNYERENVIIMAILYDSLGNLTYYTNHYKPQISIFPLTIVGSNVFDMTFIVEHHYSKATWYYNFVDSVYMESFYKKDDTTVYNNNISASLVGNTFSYRINTTLDTTLLKAGFALYYRIVAKDKGIVKETSFAPDTGYYKCVWDFGTGLNYEQHLTEFDLFQNYPNPFNPVTKIKFQIPKHSNVTLKIFDVLGREVSILLNEEKTAGIYELNFDASNLASGVYYYQLITDGFVRTRKMLVIK